MEYIDRKELLAIVPVADRTIFEMERRGEFPRRVQLSLRRVAWVKAEVIEWLEKRAAARKMPAQPRQADEERTAA